MALSLPFREKKKLRSFFAAFIQFMPFPASKFQFPPNPTRPIHSFLIPPAIRGGLTSLAKSNPIPILCPQNSHKFPRRRASAVRVKQKSCRPSVPPGHFTTCFCIAFPLSVCFCLLSKVMGFGAVASTDRRWANSGRKREEGGARRGGQPRRKSWPQQKQRPPSPQWGKG